MRETLAMCGFAAVPGLNEVKLSEYLQAEVQHVQKSLPGVICDKCAATLNTYADKCSADLCEACPGFVAIEAAKQEFRLNAESRRIQ